MSTITDVRERIEARLGIVYDIMEPAERSLVPLRPRERSHSLPAGSPISLAAYVIRKAETDRIPITGSAGTVIGTVTLAAVEDAVACASWTLHHPAARPAH
ncbi:MAG TPA: hypothetical protein VEO00_12330 [Actinomycetota bacterium]|nr:hypothetical protein [Actinomycetota bacterium]